MAPNPAPTRERLIAAGEVLFAERGIGGVSLREINQAAGQRNSTALQYHFGDRDGLLKAALAKHTPEVESRRHALLDQYEAEHMAVRPHDAAVRPHDAAVRPEIAAARAGGHGRAPTPRAGDGTAELRLLAGALVRPAATKLADADGGRAYLRIMAQLVHRADFVPSRRSISDPTDSINRWRALVGPLLPEVAVTRLHRRFAAIRITFVELSLRAEHRKAKDDRLFVSDLVDLVTALLEAPLSTETQRLLGDR